MISFAIVKTLVLLSAILAAAPDESILTDHPVKIVEGVNHLQIYLTLFATLVAPGLLAFFLGWQRKAEKRLDWEREDKKEAEKAKKADQVAKQAAEAAKLLVESNERIAAKVVETSDQTNGKLTDLAAGQKEIHTLVNSNLTKAMTSELDQTVISHGLMVEMVDLKRTNGKEPTKEVLASILASETKIGELRTTLIDRSQQAEKVEKMQGEAKEEPVRVELFVGKPKG